MHTVVGVYPDKQLHEVPRLQFQSIMDRLLQKISQVPPPNTASCYALLKIELHGPYGTAIRRS